MENSTQKQFLLAVIILALIIAPLCLNAVWAVGGPNWMYWIARSLCFSQILLLGALFILIPSKRGEWLWNILFYKPEAETPAAWGQGRRILIVLAGVLLLLAGLVTLYLLGSSFWQECRPISNCF